MSSETRRERYLNAKKKLLEDTSICKENRDLWTEFFNWQEHKLKRTNNLSKLDDGTYKTLYYYLVRFRNINQWFHNKPWKQLTKEDIKRVYDGLEDGQIVNKYGEPYCAREDYYSKIFKSKPFEMIGKADLAREVIEYSRPEDTEVRFVVEEDFRKLVAAANKTQHKLLLWLAFDIGENINALLQLRKSDFYREINPHTNEPEYRVNLRKDTLKRTRKVRSEITNYHETTEFLDFYLKSLGEHDLLFNYDYRNAKKIIDRAAETSGVKTMPSKDKITWKDLRSGMACDLLKKGWTIDEVNARLGHKPSSDEIDKYVNFLAINRHEQKKKIETFKVKELKQELERMQEREQLQARRLEELQEQMTKQNALLSALAEGKLQEIMKKHKLKQVGTN